MDSCCWHNRPRTRPANASLCVHVYKVFLGHPAAPFCIPEGADPVLSVSQGISDNKLGKQSETKIFTATFSLLFFYSGELLFEHNATLLLKANIMAVNSFRKLGLHTMVRLLALKCILVSNSVSQERTMVLKNVNVSKQERFILS